MVGRFWKERPIAEKGRKIRGLDVKIWDKLNRRGFEGGGRGKLCLLTFKSNVVQFDHK